METVRIGFPSRGPPLRLRIRFAFAVVALLALGARPSAAADLGPISPDWVAKWRSDLAFIADSVPRAHPNFFHSLSRVAYQAALDSLSARLPGLSQHEIVVDLARIVVMVGEGHTRVTFPYDPAAGFFTGHTTTATPKIPDLIFRQYPLRLRIFGDSLYVIQSDESHHDLLGGRVVTLGERSAEDAMARVEPTVPHDNESQRRDLLPTSMVCPEILHARGVIAGMERAPIVVEHRDGRRVEGTLTPVPPGTSVRWVEARDPGPLPLRDRHPEKSHWFVRVPGSRSVYARYRSVQDDKDETVARFADSLFATIGAARADRLILDLRGNVGGNGFLNRPLVQNIIRAERLWRPGGLWALTDGGTFSAAVMMAADLELRTPAILVGMKTGGHPNGYGDSRKIVLPQTGITVRVSSLYWQLTGPGDPRDGITPLLPIEERFEDWRANRDPALEAALPRATPGATWAGTWKGQAGWQAERMDMTLLFERRGSSWQGRADIPDADLHDAPLPAVRVRAGEITARWTAAGEPWTLRAALAGNRLVGLLHYKGLDFPVVLERTGEPRTVPTGSLRGSLKSDFPPTAVMNP